MTTFEAGSDQQTALGPTTWNTVGLVELVSAVADVRKQMLKTHTHTHTYLHSSMQMQKSAVKQAIGTVWQHTLSIGPVFAFALITYK